MSEFVFDLKYAFKHEFGKHDVVIISPFK